MAGRPSAGRARARGEAAGTGVAVRWDANGLVTERFLQGTPYSLWYHFGPQGETRYLTNMPVPPYPAAVVDSYLYTAYGEPVASTGADRNPFQYGGQVGYYTGPGAGLVLCGARWYNPYTARWMTRDPIGYGGGENLYGYCGESPVVGLDPSGECLLLGAAIGVGVEIGYEIFQNYESGKPWYKLSIGKIAVAGVAGAVGSGIGMLLAKGAIALGTSIFLNAAVGAGATVADNLIDHHPWYHNAQWGALGAGVMGGLGGYVGGKFDRDAIDDMLRARMGWKGGIWLASNAFNAPRILYYRGVGFWAGLGRCVGGSSLQLPGGQGTRR